MMTARAYAWVALVALLSGCVMVPEFRQLEQEVAELQGRGADVPLTGTPDTRLADLGAELDELRAEVGKLRGAVEEARHTAEEALAEAKAAREAPAAGVPPQRDLDFEGEAGALTEEVSSYEDAFRMYRGGDYSGAIDSFKVFLEAYPDSGYADNAMFWMGECHLKLGDQEKAVLVFDDVVKRYPDGNKVPDALYRQAIALLEIGSRTGQERKHRAVARQIFERIVTEYPTSERVPEARRQLARLGT